MIDRRRYIYTATAQLPESYGVRVMTIQTGDYNNLIKELERTSRQYRTTNDAVNSYQTKDEPYIDGYCKDLKFIEINWTISREELSI